jgi:hypothetical protein
LIRQGQARSQRRDQRILIGVAQVGGGGKQQLSTRRIDSSVTVSSSSFLLPHQRAVRSLSAEKDMIAWVSNGE